MAAKKKKAKDSGAPRAPRSGKRTPALTEKQRRFVQEYLVDLNATQSAIRAGYSARTAHSIANELLRSTPLVQEAVEVAMRERAARLQLTSDDVLQELAVIATSDPRHVVVGEDGRLQLAPGAPNSAFRGVSGFKCHRKVIPQPGNRAPIVELRAEIRFWDKNVALANIGRHLKLFPNVHEHSGPDGGPIETKQTGYEHLSSEDLAALARDLAKETPA